jgi:small basic protein
MELTCPECGAAIAEADLNMRAGLASCRACGAMLVVTRRDERLVAAPADKVSAKPEHAPEPEPAARTFVVSEGDDRLTVTFPPAGFGQGWRYVSVAVLALVFAVVLTRTVLVHQPFAFFMFIAGAVFIALIAVGILIAGLYVGRGVGTITVSATQAEFARRLFAFTWRERAALERGTRAEPFRMRQRRPIELFTCGLVINGRRYKLFCDLGDADMFRLADAVNGFLKRVHAEDFSTLLDEKPDAGA